MLLIRKYRLIGVLNGSVMDTVIALTVEKISVGESVTLKAFGAVYHSLKSSIIDSSWTDRKYRLYKLKEYGLPLLLHIVSEIMERCGKRYRLALNSSE